MNDTLSSPDSVDDHNGAHPDPSRWWMFRRKGMFIGVKWGIVQTFLWASLAIWDALKTPPDSIPIMANMTAVVGWSYGVCVVLIVGYYSNTAVDEAVKHKLGNK